MQCKLDLQLFKSIFNISREDPKFAQIIPEMQIGKQIHLLQYSDPRTVIYFPDNYM